MIKLISTGYGLFPSRLREGLGEGDDLPIGNHSPFQQKPSTYEVSAGFCVLPASGEES
jgi:hypothetical protein